MKRILILVITGFIYSAALAQAGSCPSWCNNPVATKNCFTNYQNFLARTTFQNEVVQMLGTDSFRLVTTSSATTGLRADGFWNLTNIGGQIGNRTTNGYLMNANDTKIELQRSNKDTIQITFTDGPGETDTAHIFGKHNIAYWDFNPPLPAASVTGFWKTNGNEGTNPATNFVGTTDGQPLNLHSDSVVYSAIGDSVFFEIGKKVHYTGSSNVLSGFKLVSSDHLGQWAGIFGLNFHHPSSGFNGFTGVGVWDSINGFYSISEYVPGVIEHEVITPGGVNVVSKLTQTTYNLGDYFSSNQYIQFDWETGQWNLGANEWNNATIYGDTVANTITNICDGGFVVKNHSNANLALCDSLNTTLTDVVHIETNLPAIQFDNTISIVDGTQGANKVLTSDANGTASWQALTSIYSTQISVPTTGATISALTGVNTLVINPAGTIATLTLNFPGSPVDNQKFTITATQEVTALTINGSNIVLKATTLALGGFASWQYISSLTTWVRIG